MSNPGGKASTDGMLTVTLEEEPKSHTVSASELKTTSTKKRSSGSVNSTTSYSNSNFTNK